MRFFSNPTWSNVLLIRKQKVIYAVHFAAISAWKQGLSGWALKLHADGPGLWEFLFPADFLFFLKFSCDKFQLFLLLSAYFWHFTLISLCFSFVFCMWPLTPLWCFQGLRASSLQFTSPLEFNAIFRDGFPLRLDPTAGSKIRDPVTAKFKYVTLL